MSEPATPAEELLSTYLDRRELSYEYEKRSGGSHPDFTVDLPGGPAILEIYEPHFELPNRAGAIDTYAVVRSAMKRKARQGRGARDDGIPYVLVLGRTNTSIPFGDHNIPGALFGNLTVSFPVSVDPDFEPGEAATTVGFGSGARFQPGLNRRYSAVAAVRSFNPTFRNVERLLEQRFAAIDSGDLEAIVRVSLATQDECIDNGTFEPEAEEVRLLMFHNPYALTPLPLDAFGGPYDDQWSTAADDLDRVVYTLVAQGCLGDGVPGRDGL